MVIYYLTNTEEYEKFLIDREDNSYFTYEIGFIIDNFTKTIKEFTGRYGIDGLTEIYSKIGVAFDRIVDTEGRYIVGNSELTPVNLSASERGLLLAFMCKYLDKEVLIIGLLEALDYAHRERLLKEFRGSKDKVEVLTLDRDRLDGLEELEWRFTV